jgi:ADP-ribosylglycohydrolase
MRIAPLAFVVDQGDTQDRRTIRDVCRITHRNDKAYIGALSVVLAIRSVITGNWSKQRRFLAAAVSGLPDSAVQDSIEQCASDDVSLRRSDATLARLDTS